MRSLTLVFSIAVLAVVVIAASIAVIRVIAFFYGCKTNVAFSKDVAVFAVRRLLVLCQWMCVLRIYKMN